jgi:hypothetical protein
VVGSCEHGNEALGSIKGRGILDQLSDLFISVSRTTAPLR